MAAFWRNPFSAGGRPKLYPERPDLSGRNEWLFVTPRESKGWILDAICREIGSRQPGSWQVVYNPNRLPDADKYFFSHYWNYLYHLKKNPHIKKRATLVWYTHPRDVPFTIEEQVAGYNQATCVVFSCSEYRDLWISRGVLEGKTAVVLGGADPWLFRGHRRGRGHVGLSSSFYERKSPDTVLDVVQAMPARRFTLVGRNWRQYRRFDELERQPNFKYVEAPYKDYPRYYARFDVFLSMAMLEGGPISLLEAMIENVVPVASRTGFSPDIIADGENGYLFPVGSGADVIVPLIETAFTNSRDIRASVASFTWDDFAREMHRLAEGGAPAQISARTPLFESRGPTAAEVASPGTATLIASDDEDDETVSGDQRLEETLRGWTPRLMAKPSVERPVSVIVIEFGSGMNVLNTPLIRQLLDSEVEPFIVLSIGDASLADRLDLALRRTGLDGLIETTTEPAEAVVAGLASGVRVAVIRDPDDTPDTSGVERVTPPQDGVLDGGATESHPILQQDRANLLVTRPAGHGLAILLTGGRYDARSVLRLAPRGQACRMTLPLPSPLILRDETEVEVTPVPVFGEVSQLTTVRFSAEEIKPRMLNVFKNRGGGGNAVIEAFAASVGASLSYAEDEIGPRPGIPVVWGVLRGSDRVLEFARSNGQHFYYIDHAYFGRGHGLNYRISRNAYEAGAVKACPPDRIEALGVRLRPWRAPGSTILVCPPTQFFMDAHGCPNWLEDSIAALRRATDRPIEIRRKPRNGDPSEPLENALNRAWAVVTHSSNIAVEAVTSGVPAFVAETSAALHVSETDLSLIETPRRPDREAWLAHLAYCQFSFAEVGDGTAWRLLIENESRPLVDRPVRSQR